MGFAGLCMLVLIDQWQVRQWRSGKISELAITAKLYKNRLEQAVLSRFNAVESLGALFALNPETTPEEFEYFSLLLLKNNHPIRAIQYADPTSRVKYSYPAKGNEITISNPMVLLNDPARRPYTKKAIDQKITTLQGPFELRQGGMGVVVRYPIFKSEKFIGLAIGVYNVEDLVDEVFTEINQNQLYITMSDNKGKIFLGKKHSSERSQKQNIHVADSIWTLSLTLKKGLLPTLGIARTLIWVLGCGFILAVLLFLRLSFSHTMRLEKTVQKRTKELSDINKQLANEIAERKKFEGVLKKSERRFKEMIEKSPLPMMIMDSHQNTMSYNDKFMETFGFAFDEINTFEKWWIRTCPDKTYRAKNQQTWAKAIQKAKATKSNIEMQEWDLTIKDGTERRCEFHMVPLGDYSLTIIKDITVQKQTEKELEAHRMHLESKVAERTTEINDKLTELERMNDLFVGREFRIKELRDKIKALEEAQK